MAHRLDLLTMSHGNLKPQATYESRCSISVGYHPVQLERRNAIMAENHILSLVIVEKWPSFAFKPLALGWAQHWLWFTEALFGKDKAFSRVAWLFGKAWQVVPSWKGRSACRRVLRHGTCNPVETNAVVVNTASETTNLQQVLLFKIELKLSELKTIRTRNEPKILSKLELPRI